MSDDELKQRILSRRGRFVAAALAASGVAACGGEVSGPADAASDAPQACLTPIQADAGDAGDAGPPVCLDVAFDAGVDANDGGPQVCLAPLPDGG